MYIKYTLVNVANLLYLPSTWGNSVSVTIPFAIEALSLGFGFSLGFLHGSDNWLAILEVSLLSLALLETSGLINHQQLMLLFDSYIRDLKHRE
jgi:hypothetical protein